MSEDFQKAIFIPQDKRCGTKIDPPTPASKTLAPWYRDAHKYLKATGEAGSLEEVKKGEAFPTYKNCVPVFDGMTTGYTFSTICDLTVSYENGIPKIECEPGYEEFVGMRGPTREFAESLGQWSDHHFHWVPSWAIKLPEGYSALYVNPLNRIDLPFFTLSGIIDNDRVHMTGQYPFLLNKHFEGVIPKGTPFVQIIPIKREDWKSEVTELSGIEIELDRHRKPFKYRKHKVNYYRKHDWQRKSYE